MILSISSVTKQVNADLFFFVIIMTQARLRRAEGESDSVGVFAFVGPWLLGHLSLNGWDSSHCFVL